MLLISHGQPLYAQLILEVDTWADDSDLSAGDGVCATAANECSLRAAIEEANAYPNAGVPDRILFTNIPILAWFAMIEVINYELPAINDPIIIDATTAAGDVILDATNNIASVWEEPTGIILAPGSDGSLIRGLTIGNFGRDGIKVQSNNNTIQDNYVGLASDGSAMPVDQYGIFVTGEDNVIGGAGKGNIVGNCANGIYLLLADRNKIWGNFVGTDPAGRNHENGSGIFVNDSADNVVGGLLPERGNTTGFNARGIYLAGATRTTVRNNFVGTDVSGRDLGNTFGIDFYESEDNLIGGLSDFGNTIGFNLIGIQVRSASSNNKIQGNYVGTNEAGDMLGNDEAGVSVYAVGTTDNKIGYGKNVVIPTDAPKGNTIAFNGAEGIVVDFAVPDADSPSENTIRGNRIYDNQLLGIDLGEDGFTGNDVDDADEGPNGLLNFPDVVQVGYNGGRDVIAIEYSVSSDDTIVSYPLNIDVYIADGNGQGNTFIGTDSYSTSGDVTIFDVDASSINWASDDVLVLTVTDADGNTSEFSPASNQIGGPGNPLALSNRDALQLHDEQPAAFNLSQAYPNPFNPQTTFTLTLPEATHTLITVHDMLGRQVALLHDGNLSAGLTHTFTFDASNLSSGTYLLRVKGKAFVETRKLLLVK